MKHLRMRKAMLFALLVLLTAGLLTGCTSQETEPELPPVDRVSLFDHSQMVIRFSSTAELVQTVQESPLGELWASKDMEAFRDGKMLHEHIEEAIQAGSASPDDIRLNEIYLEEVKMLSGEVILGFIFPAEEEEPDICVAAAMTREKFERSLELDAVTHELEDTETVVASEMVNGIEVYTYVVKREDVEEDQMHYQAFVQGTLLMGNDREWLERSMAVLVGNSVVEPEEAPTVSMVVKPTLLAAVKQKMAENMPTGDAGNPADAERIFNSFGLDTIGDVSMTFVMEPESARFDATVQKAGDWNHGIPLIFPQEPAPMAYRLSYIPDEPASYGISRVAFTRVWKEIPVILKQVSPEMEAKFNLAVGTIGGMLQISFDNDLFGNLDGLMFNYSRISGKQQEWVYGFGVKDAGAMEQTLFTLFDENAMIRSQIGDMYRDVSIQGHTIHMLKIPGAAMDPDGPMFQNIGVTILDQALVVGHEPLVMDYVQSVVANAGEPDFYKSRQFASMVEHTPPGAFRYSMGSLSQIGELALERIRAAAMDEDDAFLEEEAEPMDNGDEVMDKFLDGFQYDKLPSNETISRYLGNYDEYGLVNQTGLNLGFSIRYPKNE